MAYICILLQCFNLLLICKCITPHFSTYIHIQQGCYIPCLNCMICNRQGTWLIPTFRSMCPPVTANYTAVCVQDLHTQKTCLCSELSKNYNRSIIPSKSVESTKSCRVSRVAACTRAQSLTVPCLCATYIWLLHPASTSAQDGLDPLQLVLVVFFLPSISAKTSLALEVGIICNLRWWCFLVLTI